MTQFDGILVLFIYLTTPPFSTGVLPCSCRYLIDNGGITAIDPYARRLYAFLQKVGGNITDPFDLVGIDMTSGEVMSRVQACKQPAYCPWSLEFLPQF